MSPTSESKTRGLGFLGTALLYLLTCSFGVVYVDSAICSKGCDLALGSYYIPQGYTLTLISSAFNTTNTDILNYNTNLPNQDSIQAFSRINVPFSCDCLRDGNVLAKIFQHTIQKGDTYDTVARNNYSNLSTAAWMQSFNSYSASSIPATGTLNVPVNCTCGNSSVSDNYGLFITYPLRSGETLQSVASYGNVTTSLLQSYNPGVNFSSGSGLVYIPTKDRDGSFRPLTSSSTNSPTSGISGGTIAGVSVGVVVLIVFGIAAVFFIRRRKTRSPLLLSDKPEIETTAMAYGTSVRMDPVDRAGGIMVDKSVEFSYEQLADATDNFSLANKIGQGGFGAVYYAELNGERAAIKKMDMQASREFMAELKVLTNVHHLNLVRLIGYCIENSLCLVYEYIENGNLSQHLRGSGVDPLPWSARVQIALDSARGLEYIHEHTVPAYIHRDIKSANILIDQNFRAKVADFGLTKLTEVGTTRLVGTFGYMPPEYAQYGEVSPKVDVYAFGVVLYELISAKEAVVKQNDMLVESKGLVGMFDEVFSKPDPNAICNLIDPRLGDNYPLDAVLKMAQIARACTSEDPQLRPTMRSAAVALMALSSSTEEWDASPFYQNQGFVHQMSGR